MEEIKGRDKIIEIGNEILDANDIIAQHGTSKENADSIMKTGFNYNKTSYVMNSSKNVLNLCCYSWKELSDSNVILSIPQKFIREFLNINEDEYNSWITKIKENKLERAVLKFFTDITWKKANLDQNKQGKSGLLASLGGDFITYNAHIPKEFVAGIFSFLEGKDSFRFNNDKSESLDYLEYISNDNFYNNLNDDDKKLFIDSMKRKIYEKINQNLIKKADFNQEDCDEILKTVIDLLKMNPYKVLEKFTPSEVVMKENEMYSEFFK